MSHTENAAAREAETDRRLRLAGDKLISIADIRLIFKLGRTAAYELTRRPGFPDRVEISPRCHRWWAREVDEFAATLRRPRSQARTRPEHDPAPDPAIQPRRISGTVRAIRSRKAPS